MAGAARSFRVTLLANGSLEKDHPNCAYHDLMDSIRERIAFHATETSDERYREMTEAPVGPLIVSLAVPSILANLVSAIYNIADTFFVGKLGTSASGAIGIAFVAMTGIQAVGFYFGQGTGNAIARYLGAKENEKACVMASTGLVCAFGFGIVIAVLGNVLLEPICLIAGATPTILPYAKTFIGIVLLGAPWMCSELMLNMQLRLEGESLFSMICIMTGAVLNIALTPLFVFVFGMGIAGSALATIVCEFVSFLLLIWQMQRVGITPLSLRYVHPTTAFAREVNNGGVPSFVRQCMLGVATTLLNNAANPFGDAVVAAMAVVQRIAGFGNYVQIGIGQGFQPVIGYNIGARNYDRVREGYFFSLRVAMLAVLGIGILTCVFAPQLIGFLRNDPDVIEAGTLTLRLTSFSMVFTGAAMVTNFMLQTSGHMWRATILGACRLGLVLGPVVVILSQTMGLLGVQLAQPLSDVITGIVTIPMAISCLRDFAREEQRQQKS